MCALAECLFVLWCAIIVVFSGGGDAGGYRHSTRLVTRQNVCKLQHYSCPCAVCLVAVGLVLGDEGGVDKGKAASAKPMGAGNNLNYWWCAET